ncbi:MAG: squalene/phytoene synthase family protein [Planctomycetota bacterium]
MSDTIRYFLSNLLSMTALPLAAQQSPLQVARASGSNFLLSFLFLSPGRRRALLAVYAFCRVVDDAVDKLVESDSARRKAAEHLSFWEAELEAAFDGRPRTPIGFALHRAAQRFALEKEPLAEVCRGVRMDFQAPSYASFEDLEIYMSRVASAVGIACLPVFGADRERSRPYAEVLGKALQYTNILRDLAEDADRGRCYLPSERLRAHEVRPEWLRRDAPEEALEPGGAVARLLRGEHERAEELYVRARELLPSADRRALRPARIMGSIYHDLLQRVSRLGPRILHVPRVRVPVHRKVYLACFGLW